MPLSNIQRQYGILCREAYNVICGITDNAPLIVNFTKLKEELLLQLRSWVDNTRNKETKAYCENAIIVIENINLDTAEGLNNLLKFTVRIAKEYRRTHSTLRERFSSETAHSFRVGVLIRKATGTVLATNNYIDTGESLVPLCQGQWYKIQVN